MKLSVAMEDKVVAAVKEFAGKVVSGGKIAMDMSSLINATSELPLSRFDYWERLIRNEYANALRACGDPKNKARSEPIVMVTWLDLINYDGYRRERALRTLSGAAPNSFFLSLVIRRLNDWVPQVREAAIKTLPQIILATPANYVVESLCIALANWNSWGRIDDAGKKILLRIICDENIAGAFISLIIKSPSGPMASLFSQLGRTSILDGRIEEIAANAVQPSVRAKAYRSLFDARITWVEGREWVWTDKRYCEGKLISIVAERTLNIRTPALELIQRSSKDTSSIVRRVSAEMLIRELENIGLEKSREFAEEFALDKSFSVSERGGFALRQLNEMPGSRGLV